MYSLGSIWLLKREQFYNIFFIEPYANLCSAMVVILDGDGG
jgi:hypothetical protein